MDQGDSICVVGQVKRFLNGCIPPANDADVFTAEEKPVTGRAGRNAKTYIGFVQIPAPATGQKLLWK